jgi:hypothetical protein
MEIPSAGADPVSSVHRIPWTQEGGGPPEIMSKTLLAVVAAGGMVTAGVAAGAMVGSAIANTFFNVSIGVIRTMRRLRCRLQSR